MPVSTRRRSRRNGPAATSSATTFAAQGSSPILWADLLFLPYDGYDYQYVVALDQATGDTVWKINRPHNFGTSDGDQKKAYGTAQVIRVGDAEQLIVPTSKGVLAYDPAHGERTRRVR